MKKVNLFLVDARNLKFKDLDVFSFSNEEKTVIDRLKIETSKIEKAVSFLLKRKFVGDYSLNEYGKPISKDKYFNVSHSKGIVAIALSEYPIGLDLELIRPYRESLKTLICNDIENEYIKSSEDFYKVWTSKESLVKCIGTGFKCNLKAIPALPLEGRKEYSGKTYSAKALKINNIAISLTLETNQEFNIELTDLKIEDL